MALRERSAAEVVRHVVDALAFDPDVADLATPEVTAALIRRAAAHACPASPRSLEQAVEESVLGLVDVAEAVDIRGVIDLLVAYGDLVEARVEAEDSIRTRRVLFLARPSFVAISDSTAVLLGIAPEGTSVVDASLRDRVITEGCVRRVNAPAGLLVAEWLKSLGLQERSSEHWLNSPRDCTAVELLAEYDAALDASVASGETPSGVRVLDPASPTSYYRGRWRIPTAKDEGRFIFRVPVRFGSDAWGYGHFRGGDLLRFLSLPSTGSGLRGCDEAWRLQAAIDATRGLRQEVRVRVTGSERVVLELLAPLPAWAQRRLDCVGSQTIAKGALLAYAMSRDVLPSELQFLEAMMWTSADHQDDTRV